MNDPGPQPTAQADPAASREVNTGIDAGHSIDDIARDLERAQRAGKVGSLLIDYSSGLWSTSKVGCDLLGLDDARPRGTRAFLELVLPADRQAMLAAIRHNAATGHHADTEFRILRPNDGAIRWIRTSADTDFGVDGRPCRRLGVLQDITDQKLAEQRYAKLARIHTALTRTFEAVARAESFAALSMDACRISVEEGGLVAALIRLYDPAARSLQQIAEYGCRTGLARREVVGIDDPEGIAGTAFRERRRHIVTSLDAHPGLQAIERDAAGQGVRAAAAFPLIADGKPIGTFTVFAADAEALDPQTADLLEEVAGAIAFAHSRHAAEAGRRESEARMHAVVESAMDAIISTDEAAHVLMFNRAAEAMFGMPASRAIGAPLTNLMPERFHALHGQWMSAFAAAGATSRSMGNPGEVTAMRADGSEFPVEASISHSLASGRLVFTVIMRDVTGRLAAQRAVSEAEQRYRSLVENSSAGIALLEGECVEYANAGLARMLGARQPQDLDGVNLVDMVIPRFRQAARANVRALVAMAGRSIAPGRMRLRRADGAIVDVEAAAASIEIGGRILVQAELRDITGERHALAGIKALNRTLERRVAARTAELTHTNRDLEAANRDLESFSYSVAHDLRAPLRTMTGFAELLRSEIADGVSEHIPGHLTRIVDQAGRMNVLIDGLLNVARASHGALSNDRVDMQALARQIARDLDPTDRTRVAIPNLPSVRADAAAMRQVLANLLSNACKYSARRAHPEIDISYRIDEHEAVFEVRDNGAGFEERFAAKLFGVFQRLHSSHEFEGSGVGLAIVRRIIERHGGRVWARGEVDVGATFGFSLPIERVLHA